MPEMDQTSPFQILHLRDLGRGAVAQMTPQHSLAARRIAQVENLAKNLLDRPEADLRRCPDVYKTVK